MGNCRCYIGIGINGNLLIVRFFNMRIGSITENKKFEKRIAVTPEIVKKYIK